MLDDLVSEENLDQVQTLLSETQWYCIYILRRGLLGGGRGVGGGHIQWCDGRKISCHSNNMFSNCRDETIDKVRPVRNELCDLLGIPRPVIIKVCSYCKKIQKSACNKLVLLTLVTLCVTGTVTIEHTLQYKFWVRYKVVVLVVKLNHTGLLQQYTYSFDVLLNTVHLNQISSFVSEQYLEFYSNELTCMWIALVFFCNLINCGLRNNENDNK